MRHATKTGIVTAVVETVGVVSLTLAMNLLMVSSAQATAELAKGKPCTACHTAKPPTKDNVKKDAPVNKDEPTAKKEEPPKK